MLSFFRMLTYLVRLNWQLGHKTQYTTNNFLKDNSAKRMVN